MKHIIRSIFVLALIFQGFLIASAQEAQPIVTIQPTPKEPLGEPYIARSPDYFYPFDEVLYIEGRAEPGAIVSVELRKESGTEKPVKFTEKTDVFGEWVVAEKVYLSPGNWQVRARQQLGTRLSGESNPRVIRSIATGITVLGMHVRYIIIAAFGLVFLGILLSIFFYFRRKVRLLERGLMEKQLKDTEERFHRGFSEIRKDLMDQLKDLALNSQGRTLTPEEVGKRDHILRELEELEKNLEHDIGGIGKR
ncbi:MAG TPA: hypothetical protein VJB92_01915 [Candidatus Paceibacterota bacterium]